MTPTSLWASRQFWQHKVRVQSRFGDEPRNLSIPVELMLAVSALNLQIGPSGPVGGGS